MVWGIVEAQGGNELNQVVVAPYNKKWQADKKPGYYD